jgi:hypothetical protein
MHPCESGVNLAPNHIAGDFDFASISWQVGVCFRPKIVVSKC